MQAAEAIALEDFYRRTLRRLVGGMVDEAHTSRPDWQRIARLANEAASHALTLSELQRVREQA